MREFTILLPLLRDSDKQPHRATLWCDVERWLLSAFGGFTDHGIVRGAWLDNDKQVVRDESRKYSVAFECPYSGDGSLAGVRFNQIAKHCRAAFDQQCIYICESGKASLVS